MRLKILAISDTHLGDKVSLLSSSLGRRHLCETLREQLGFDGELEIEELILLGDLFERAWSPAPKVASYAQDFMQALMAIAAIKRMVYLVGDHDHTLLTAYRRRRYGEGDSHHVTALAGELIIEQGRLRGEVDGAEELLSLLFGYPSGPLWREIQAKGNLDFAVANPVYARELGGRTYAFAHGTHFRREAVAPGWAKKLANRLTPDRVLKVGSFGDVREANNLAELERIVAPLFDGLLPASEDNPAAARITRLFYLSAALRGKFGKVRDAPKQSRLFSRKELARVPQERIRHLTPNGQTKHHPLRWWRKYFLPHMLAYLEDNGLTREEITFVFGDTHDGGWGELPLESGGQIRIYNLGGWVLYDAKGHPDCHLFAVDEGGEEYLLDVSFGEMEKG